MASIDTLLHPVRFRVLRLMIDGQPRTASTLAAQLGDVPTASLYRQIRILVDAGVLEVDSEQRVRGVVEREYRIVGQSASISAEDRTATTPDDHRRAFLALVHGLIGSLDRYLRERGQPDADGLSYQENALWLTDEEHDLLMRTMSSAIAATQANHPGPGRRRREIAMISIPSEGDALPRERSQDETGGRTGGRLDEQSASRSDERSDGQTGT